MGIRVASIEIEGRVRNHLWHVCRITGYDYDVAVEEVQVLLVGHPNLSTSGATEHIIGSLWDRWRAR